MILKLRFFLSVVLWSGSFALARGQGPASPPSPAPSLAAYDPAQAAQQMAALKAASPKGERIRELIRACEEAAAHQDADTLVLATTAEQHPNVRKRALELLATLPLPLQRRAFAQVLLDEDFWRMDHVGSYREMEMMGFQQQARTLISKLLGRDLRTLSKHYDPDLRKQLSAEAGDLAPTALISREAREQAAKDLLASATQ